MIRFLGSAQDAYRAYVSQEERHDDLADNNEECHGSSQDAYLAYASQEERHDAFSARSANDSFNLACLGSSLSAYVREYVSQEERHEAISVRDASGTVTGPLNVKSHSVDGSYRVHATWPDGLQSLQSQPAGGGFCVLCQSAGSDQRNVWVRPLQRTRTG